jgi:hypothetical protein
MADPSSWDRASEPARAFMAVADFVAGSMAAVAIIDNPG